MKKRAFEGSPQPTYDQGRVGAAEGEGLLGVLDRQGVVLRHALAAGVEVRQPVKREGVGAAGGIGGGRIIDCREGVVGLAVKFVAE